MTDNTDKSNNLNNPHDKFFKAVFSMRTVVRACLVYFLPKNILDKLDLDTLEMDKTSYITPELTEYHADIVWRCAYKKEYQQAETGFIFEHKSYKPPHPHFQLWDYKRGAWRIQLLSNKPMFPMIPIILYHGQDTWEVESFDSYFGKIEPESLRFMPCFDYLLINLPTHSDENIHQFEPAFLQKTFLAFKHAPDAEFIKNNIVKLWLLGYENPDAEETIFFIRAFGVYLAAISKVTRADVIRQLKLLNNNLNSDAMNFIEEFIEEGIEKGIEKGKKIAVYDAWKRGNSVELLANVFALSVNSIKQIVDEMKLEDK